MINTRRFTYIALLALVVVLLLSGCEITVRPGEYIKGRVTSADPEQGISGVKIIYSGSRSGTTTTNWDGEGKGCYLKLRNRFLSFNQRKGKLL